MGYLGLTHDWSTIQAIATTVADRRRLPARRARRRRRGRRGRRGRGRGRVPRRRDGRPHPRRPARGRVGDLGPVQVGVTSTSSWTWTRCAGRPTRSPSSTASPSPREIGREVRRSSRPGGGGWSPTRSTGTCSTTARTTYLPEKLRRFVLARDGGCRTPGCTTKAASRLQMDHADPFPGGHEQRRQLRRPLHHLPPAQDRRATPTSPTPTPTGPAPGSPPGARRIHVPPRSVLPTEPDPPPVEPAPPTPDDPPPF